MLKELTSEQEEIMFDVKDEFIRNATIYKEINEQKLHEDIMWIYKLMNFHKPLILIADNWYEQQLMMNIIIENQILKLNSINFQVKKQLLNKIWNQTGIQIVNQVENKVKRRVIIQLLNKIWNQTGTQIVNQVENQVRDKLLNYQVEDQIKNKVLNQVEDQLNNQLLTQKNNQLTQKSNQLLTQKLKFNNHYYGIWYNSCWLAFNEFFKRINIVESTIFDKYSSFCQNGICNILFFDSFVFVSRMPKKILRSSDGRLHSTEESAIQWKGNYNNYFIESVNFEKELWTKIIKRELSAIELLKIENIEQRYIGIKLLGAEKLFKQLDNELISKTKRGNELYNLKKVIEGQELKVLKYRCPSTNNIYFKFVPSEINNADEAQAWSFQISIEEYRVIKKET